MMLIFYLAVAACFVATQEEYCRKLGFSKPMLDALPRYQRKIGGVKEFEQFDMHHFATLTHMRWEQDIYNNLPKSEWSSRLRPGSVVLDIGANFGAFTRRVVESCPKCLVLAFEPVPEYAGLINYRYGWHPHVSVFPYALGDTLSSFDLWLSPTNLGWNTMEQSRATPEMRKTRIEVRRFDTLIRMPLDISFIKIDVEGSEWRVLRGMRQTLLTTKPSPVLLIEVAWPNMPPNWEEKMVEFNWLFEHGYKRVDFTNMTSTQDVLFEPNY